MTRTRGFCVKADNSYREYVTGSLLISFDGDDGDVVEVRALTLLGQREVRALSCALSLSRG